MSDGGTAGTFARNAPPLVMEWGCSRLVNRFCIRNRLSVTEVTGEVFKSHMESCCVGPCRSAPVRQGSRASRGDLGGHPCPSGLFAPDGAWDVRLAPEAGCD